MFRSHDMCWWQFYDYRNWVCIPSFSLGLHYLIIYIPSKIRYYPTPSIDKPEKLISCPQDTFGDNACNPDRLQVFTCRKGHTGRLCSVCEAGYRRNGMHQCCGNRVAPPPSPPSSNVCSQIPLRI